MALDPTIVEQFEMNALRGMTRQSDLADQAGRDAASVLLFDHRSLSAAIAREVAMAADPATAMDYNTAARTPSTLDHYALGAGPSAPGAAGGSQAATGGTAAAKP